MKKNPKFVYQPVIPENEIHFAGSPYSFEVYRYRENAEKDFEGYEIKKYKWGDIEEPTIVDDLPNHGNLID